MKLIAKATASIKKGMDREFKILTEGIKAGTKDAGRALQSSLRKQVVTAGMKKRLANTWRFKFFPNKGFNPASFVFSKAPEIIRAFDKGVLIRAGAGNWLAIPTKNAPKKIGKFKATPAQLLSKSGTKLRFVPVNAKTALLVIDEPGSSSRRRRKTSKRKPRAGRSGSLVMFVLVKQVKIPKKLGVERSARKWAGKTPELIERELAKIANKGKNV